MQPVGQGSRPPGRQNNPDALRRKVGSQFWPIDLIEWPQIDLPAMINKELHELADRDCTSIPVISRHAAVNKQYGRR
jgi:hypothetical protein